MTPMSETAGTRMFRLGRTDTIRNTTSEAHEFVKTMQDTSASVSEGWECCFLLVFVREF